MSKLFNWAAARLVAAFALALPLAADASPLLLAAVNALEKENPVTGETEIYDNGFDSEESSEWNSAGNWTLKETDKVPFVSGGNYDPALVDGKTVSTVTAIDGWTLRVGAYNGAAVTWNGGITKIQAGSAGCWLTADETSSITIASFAGNQLEGGDAAPFKLSSAKAGGITWSAGLTSSSNNSLPFWYYLKGAGTVVYGGDITVANAQVIKMADVALSGTSQVASKTLVTFGSGTTKTFTADATIKRLNSSGMDLNNDAHVTTVNATGATTLTTSDDVGTCELVQTSTGVVLYYVDGDPADVPVEEKTYKPSININFTSGAANGLTTSADVGLEGYAVPGTSWNNFTIPNNANEQTFNTVNSIDSTGAASVAAGVSVKVSGHRGSYSCGNLTAASNPLHGYIDEGAQKATPTVTITGIPYEHYRVIVYHSTDTANVPFGYDTINGFNFTYVNGVQTTGTDSWGASGADQSAEPIAEGTNTLVSAVLSGGTVTMVAHRIGGATPSARGCFAAIQVVEYVPEVGENDLEIAVDGATNYAVDTAKTLSGTVYLTGSGTLTLTGSEKITAATIDVAKDVVLNINTDRLDATTFTGAGTVVYDTTAPVEGKGWANIGWSGTVWIKNQSVSSFEGTKFGNAASTVRFTGVTGFLQTSSYNSSTYVHTVPLELVDEGNTVAFTYNNGWGGNLVKINTLKGTGTLYTEDKGSGEHIYIVDASGFSGVFNLTCKYVYVGGSQPADYSASTNPNGKLEIRSGVTMTVPSGKTWTANGGFVVNGTLNVDGTLASSHTTKAVSGAGTVVFTGRAPTVSGDAWWKNADWTGTVQVKDVTNMVGDSRAGVWLKFNDYGNSGSVVEMNNVTGWLETGYTCTPKIKITGTLYLNNGGSGKASAFKVGTLLGSGTISGDGSAVTVVFNITDDWSGFTGTIGLNNKCIVFGETIPDELTAGTIYISEGAVVTPQQSSGVWWGVGGIKVDGELRAPNLGKFGGGTTITTSDNGIFTLTDSNDTNDSGTDYARITGTGTLRYADVSGKWRALSKVNFPTNMICENNLSAGLILTTQGDNIIGSLAGSGQMRSDWGGSGNTGDRDLLILQARDTTYSGLFASSNDRVRDVYVKPGAATAGTLTLSGAQTASNDLAIESGAKVNLTGTWVGATTVAGTFGGTGTLTGDLTFSDGATFKAAATALTVSGTVALPTGEGESLTIDATGLDVDEATILSSSSITTETDVSKVTVNGLYTVTPVAGALKLVSIGVEVTVPTIPNTTVTVAVGGETIGTDPGTYKVAPDSVVTVTYAAAPGYEISGTTEYTIDTSKSETTFDPSETTHVAQYVASITTGELVVKYTTLQAAVTDAAAINNGKILLLASADGMVAAIPAPASGGRVQFYIAANGNAEGTINAPAGDYIMTTASETIPIGNADYDATKYTVTEAAVAVTVGESRSLYGASYINDAVSAAIAGGLGSTIEFVNGTDSTPYVSTLEASGFTVENNVWTFTTLPVARVTHGVTEISYLTLAAAFANVQDGDTITVLTNNTLTGGISVTNNTLTLDLNGYTVTGAADDVPMFNVGAVSFTITDTSEGKTGKAVSASSKVILSSSACTITLTAGTLQSGDDVIWIYGSDGERVVNIYGGKIVCNNTGWNEAYAIANLNGTVNMTAGEIESKCSGFYVKNANISGGSVKISSESNRKVFYDTKSSDYVNVAVSGGTFNATFDEKYLVDGYEMLNNGDGTYTVRKDNGWMYAAPGYWNYTGAWSEGAVLGADKVAFESNATYTASNPSAGQLVTVEMTLSFDDTNDDVDGLEDAKSAVRLAAGETDGTYQFQLYTSDGANKVWTNATVDVTANKEVDYAFVFVLDLTNKTYTASIVSGTTTNAMTVGGVTNIMFACQDNVTAVQRIDFVGSGTVTSIKGSYETPKFVPGATEIVLSDVTTNITLTAKQADWLNACGSMSEVKAALAGIGLDAFDRAYLLNLNILDENYEDVEKPLSVTAFDVGDASVTVEVTLIRKGKLGGGINGTLKLTGTADLDDDFDDISDTPVGDDDFSEGNTATWTFDKGSEKFFKPVIE